MLNNAYVYSYFQFVILLSVRVTFGGYSLWKRAVTIKEIMVFDFVSCLDRMDYVV